MFLLRGTMVIGGELPYVCARLCRPLTDLRYEGHDGSARQSEVLRNLLLRLTLNIVKPGDSDQAIRRFGHDPTHEITGL